MKYLLVFVLFFTLYNEAFASDCKITMYNEVYYDQRNLDLDPDQFFKSYNCSYQTAKSILKIILKYDSELKAKYIENLLSETFSDKNISISPKQFKVASFEGFLNKKIGLSGEQKIINTNILNTSKIIKIRNNETLRVSCHDCHYPGHKNIKVIVSSVKSNSNHIEWVNAVVAEKVKVLSALNNISISNKGIGKNSFKTKYIYAVRPEIYFSNPNEIKFYKLNKPIKKNTPLKNTDIVPLNLVKYGHPSQVIFYKNGIHLTGTAIPVKNGKYNELIRLKRKNNTIITGTVINFNKVKVEL